MMGNPWAEGMPSMTEIAGKTVESTEVVPAAYGTTPDGLLLVRFTDGSRTAILIKGHGSGAKLQPMARFLDSEAMRQAPRFFEEEEVAAEVIREMQQAKQRERQEREYKQRELERLQKELARG